MGRYKIWIEYDGTRFYGWQSQPGGNTVQDNIEKAISRVLRADIGVMGQGRTDSGVHAWAQTAHFDYTGDIEFDRFKHAMRGVLPSDIAIWEIQKVAPDFHARFDAVGRTYEYQILTRSSPINRRYAYLVLQDLNKEKMKQCAGMILGEHDFESFTKSSKEQETSICKIESSEFIFESPMITYRIKANRFVRHMVRRLVGTMLQVASGKRALENFSELLHQPDPAADTHSAPAKGLFLYAIDY